MADKEKPVVNTRNGVRGYYLYDYMYQTCFDDGGVGHDSGWSKARNQPIFGIFRTEKAVIERAKKLVGEQDGKNPCNGSFCDNKGRVKLVRIFFSPLPQEDVVIWPPKIT